MDGFGVPHATLGYAPAVGRPRRTVDLVVEVWCAAAFCSRVIAVPNEIPDLDGLTFPDDDVQEVFEPGPIIWRGKWRDTHAISTFVRLLLSPLSKGLVRRGNAGHRSVERRIDGVSVVAVFIYPWVIGIFCVRSAEVRTEPLVALEHVLARIRGVHVTVPAVHLTISVGVLGVGWGRFAATPSASDGSSSRGATRNRLPPVYVHRLLAVDRAVFLLVR